MLAAKDPHGEFPPASTLKVLTAITLIPLLNPDAEVSLGTLGAGDTGVFPVPADLDVAQFPVVDVSREPLDGNPAHSKDSVVRGTLTT